MTNIKHLNITKKDIKYLLETHEKSDNGIDDMGSDDIKNDEGLFAIKDIKNGKWGKIFKDIFYKLIEKESFGYDYLVKNYDVEYCGTPAYGNYNDRFYVGNDYDESMGYSQSAITKYEKDLEKFNKYLLERFKMRIDEHFDTLYDMENKITYDEKGNAISIDGDNSDLVLNLIDIYLVNEKFGFCDCECNCHEKGE